MALKFPLLVKMTSNTAGTSTYGFSEPAAAGYRTPTDAIADNSMASGDEVTYVAIDTGALGSANLFEFGRGVLNNTAKTLTRATVYQSSNAGAAVSWGAGTRDLYVVTAGALFAALAEANLFTANQEIEKASPLLTLDALSGDPQVHLRLSGTLRSELGMAAGSPVAYWDFFDAAGTLKGRLLNGDNRLEWATTAAASGRGIVHFPTGGTVGLIHTDAVPTGWTRQDESEDRVMRFAKAAETAGTAGGSWTISGLSVNGHALAESELPSHSHTFSNSVYTDNTSAPGGILINQTDGVLRSVKISATGASGGGGTHTHGLTADGAWRPRFRIAVRATFN